MCVFSFECQKDFKSSTKDCGCTLIIKADPKPINLINDDKCFNQTALNLSAVRRRAFVPTLREE